jgi:hypothetical protein
LTYHSLGREIGAIVTPLHEEIAPQHAAVSLDPHARLRGVEAALCARPQRAGYYERLGWNLIEREVGRHRMSVLIRETSLKTTDLTRSPP